MRFGADPEFTILDPKGKPVSAHLFDFGDKKHKNIVDANGSVAFRDGTNVEVNPTPSTCRGQFNRRLRTIVQTASQHLPKGHTLTAMPSYKLRYFKATMKDAPPDVKQFGCDPWLNAYSEQEERSEVDASTHPYRYAGGHMHFGSTPDRVYGYEAIVSPKYHAKAVKLLDLLVGIPSVVLFGTPDEFLRRVVYGRAGEYRVQRYPNTEVGLEYRTPSPRIFNHPALVTLFFGVARYAFENQTFTRYMRKWDPSIEDALQTAINTGEGAIDLLQTVPGFYTPATILELKDVPEIHEFKLGTFAHDPEAMGWTETATREWGLLVPAYA